MDLAGQCSICLLEWREMSPQIGVVASKNCKRHLICTKCYFRNLELGGENKCSLCRRDFAAEVPGYVDLLAATGTIQSGSQSSQSTQDNSQNVRTAGEDIEANADQVAGENSENSDEVGGASVVVAGENGENLDEVIGESVEVSSEVAGENGEDSDGVGGGNGENSAEVAGENESDLDGVGGGNGENSAEVAGENGENLDGVGGENEENLGEVAGENGEDSEGLGIRNQENLGEVAGGNGEITDGVSGEDLNGFPARVISASVLASGDGAAAATNQPAQANGGFSDRRRKIQRMEQAQGYVDKYTCRYCGKAFGNSGTKSKHERCHRGPQFQCANCSYSTPRKDHFDRHSRAKGHNNN